MNSKTPATPSQHLVFKDTFRSLFTERFQAWFEDLVRLFHCEGDFQRIRNTSGDGGLDGFVINEQLVYQVYAPSRINELYDSKTAAKIKADFKTSLTTLAGQLKQWVFVHNHPQAALGKKSVAALSALKKQNPNVLILVLNIDSLWDKLKVLPKEALDEVGLSGLEAEEQSELNAKFSDLQKTIEAGNKTIETISNVVLELRQSSAFRSSNAEAFSGSEHLKTEHQKRFDRARHELLHGSIIGAEKDYRALIEDLEQLGPAADTLLLFRSYTNLGSSLWQQFRREDAMIWFDKAYSVRAQEPKAKTNKALCHLHRKEFAAAVVLLNEIKASDSESFDTNYLVAMSFAEQNDLINAQKTLEDKVFDNNDYFVTLARIYILRRKFPEATEAARQALKKELSSEALTALADSLAFPLVQKRMQEIPIGLSLTEDDMAKAHEAISSYNKAIQILKPQQCLHQLQCLHTNLSAFYSLIGDEEAAALAIRDALDIDPVDGTALANLWVLQMRLKKFSDAYETAARIIILGEVTGGKLRQLEALLLNRDYTRFVNECRDSENLEFEGMQGCKFIEMKATAYFESNECTQAFDTIEKGLLKFANHPRLYGTRAVFHQKLGDIEAARKDIDRLEETAQGNELYALLKAAYFFLDAGDWNAALTRFVKVGSDSIHSLFHTEHLICLHNLKQYELCLALSTHAIATDKVFDETRHELAARCALYTNDLAVAATLFEKLSQHGKLRILDHQKQLARLYLRLDEPRKALAVLKKAHTRGEDDVEVLIDLGLVNSLLGQHEEAIKYARKAVDLSASDHRTHETLIKVLINAPSRCDPDRRLAESFQRSLNHLHTNSSENSLRHIHVVSTEGELNDIAELVKGHTDHVARVENLVHEKHLPVAVFVKQLGLSPYQGWLILIAHTRLHFHMAHGTAEEQTAETETAVLSKAICIDVFALFTLRLTEKLQLLSRLYSEVFVHTSVLETVVADLRSLLMSSSVPPIEIETSERNMRIRFLTDIRDFLKSDAVRLVGVDTISHQMEDGKALREALTEPSYAAMMVSKSREVPLYSDDASLRTLALSTHGVTGFCSQAFFRAAKARTYLCPKDYEDAITAMLHRNYSFVSVSSDTLTHLARSDQADDALLLQRLLDGVANPKIHSTSNVSILSEFLFNIWRNDPSKTKMNRNEVLDLCVKALFKGTEVERIFIAFVANLGLLSAVQPYIYGGILHRILKHPGLAKNRHFLYYALAKIGMDEVSAFVGKQYYWWPQLQDDWLKMGCTLKTLYKNGWL